MPILSADIKLLKSAVMADTTDGGGAMTGIAVVDGQSNNLYPDTSAMDRAFGRVNFRKVFGVAHSDDTDTLLGGHAIITDAPDDPLVHCALFKTPGWADTRATARELVERYVLKGPRLAPRLYDMHYAGSLQIKLVSFVSGTFPKSGDAIVLRTPAGVEQFVRVIKIDIANELVAVVEGGGTIVLNATVATCQLGKELEHDFAGPPPARIINDAAYAQVYSTSAAAGAKFYGIKPLAVAVVAGAYSATVDGGIYTPLVPAATVESPVIDKFPLTGRSAVCATASAAVTLPNVVLALGPGTVLTLPTAIEPGSLSFTHGGTAFAADSAGSLKQGALVVGTVDPASGRVLMAGDAPNYGSQIITLSYKPGSGVGASVHSAAFAITSQNQGLAFTNVFEPPPAPGSFALGYMAQGRWYDLLDNLAGKLSGADSSYGVGTLNYTTGSMGVTLGAIPDVGSELIAMWGDGSAAKALTGTLPVRLRTPLTLPAQAKGEGITVTWSRGANNYTATTNAAGQLTGHATGGLDYNGALAFAPDVFPDGDVTLTGALAPSVSSVISSAVVGGAPGGEYSAYTLTGGLPITPGSLSGTVLTGFDPAVEQRPSTMSIMDAAGIVYANYLHGRHVIGTIDYTTGDLRINRNVEITTSFRKLYTVPAGWSAGTTYSLVEIGPRSVSFDLLTHVTYSYGVSGPDTFSVTQTPGAWAMQLPTNGAQLVTNGTTFRLGDGVYTAAAGALRRGWSLATGAPDTTAAGAVDSGGLVTVSALPGNAVNTVVWHNAAVGLAGGKVNAGVFRTDNAPLKAGVFQLQAGAAVGQGNGAGVISGGNFAGTVDYQRGIVKWTYGGSGAQLDPADLSYNAVFLQYLPLDATLLGIETARLPLDGKVPVYRSGDLCVLHNTQTHALPNPVTRDTAHNLGRQRLASVRVKDALGATVADTLYTVDLDAGLLTVPAASSLTAYTQPLAADHRIEDMVVCSQADISGKVSFISRLTHDYPAGTSYLSSALPFGDMFARAYGVFDQSTWTGAWSDVLVGSESLANFNAAQYPITTTNRGAITERWALIFTNSTTFNVVGESVGVIGTGNTATDCSPINPATGAPYFTLPALGWGGVGGWSAGNVLRFNTDACGAPLWTVRTTLQGPASLQDDHFTLAFRVDVDRP